MPGAAIARKPRCPIPQPDVLTALLAALTWSSLGLTLLSWLGRWRQRLQGEWLASAFHRELKRRGLMQEVVVRT